MRSIGIIFFWMLAFVGMLVAGLVVGVLSSLLMLLSSTMSLVVMPGLALYIYFDQLKMRLQGKPMESEQPQRDVEPIGITVPADPVTAPANEEVPVETGSKVNPENSPFPESGMLVNRILVRSDGSSSEEQSSQVFFPYYISTDGYTDRERELFVSGLEFLPIVQALMNPGMTQMEIHSENSSRVRMLAGIAKRTVSLVPTEKKDFHGHSLISVTVQEQPCPFGE